MGIPARVKVERPSRPGFTQTIFRFLQFSFTCPKQGRKIEKDGYAEIDALPYNVFTSLTELEFLLGF